MSTDNKDAVAKLKQRAFTQAYEKVLNGSLGCDGLFDAGWDAAHAAQAERIAQLEHEVWCAGVNADGAREKLGEARNAALEEAATDDCFNGGKCGVGGYCGNCYHPVDQPSADLQAAIMALPCELPAGYDDSRERLIYLQSHTTAVARAAALVASARPSAEQGKPAQDQAQTDLMPKRAAFKLWCENRGLETVEDRDVWCRRKFKHSHIEAMWEGWFNAPVSAQGQAAIMTPTRLDVMSLIHSQVHRVYASAIDREDVDTKYMTEIEDAIMGIYHGRYIAGYDLRKSEQPAARELTDADIDKHLDQVMRASGSALKYFSMPETIEGMRTAMRDAMRHLTGNAGAATHSKE